MFAAFGGVGFGAALGRTAYVPFGELAPKTKPPRPF